MSMWRLTNYVYSDDNKADVDDDDDDDDHDQR